MYTARSLIGEQGWRSDESPLLPIPTMCGPGSNPGVDANKGCVCCSFSPLHREVFLWVLRFSALIKSQRFQSPIRPWMAEEEPVCGCATTKSFFTTSKLLFLYLFIYLFIYLQFCCQLPINATGTVVHALISMINVHPTGNVAHSTTTNAHLQLTTVVVARSSRPSLFHSSHFWDQWGREVTYFNLYHLKSI